MKLLLSLILVTMILHCSYAPPVNPEKNEQDSEIKDDLEEYMEYHRYLKEVVQALESDPDFRERLEKADEDDVRSGKIAEQLDFVSHNVRSKLDEIKRRELERLRHLATKQYELTNNLDTDTGKVPTNNEHLDHANPHTFEIEDLKKLIKKTTADLEAADKERRQQFKEYEMEKEFEKHQKLEGMDDTQKKEFEEKLKNEEEAKKHHQPLHHPGSKPQLEEVWEKQDHMDQQFDPKAFFMMHDVDGNGVWDADEVKALFIKELDKLYSPNGPNKDLHERAEEMERMREHVFRENDKNRDGLIDFNEFIMETQKAEFNQDEGWKSLDENQIYTASEYEEFQRRRLEEVQYLQQRGLVDAHGRPMPGAQHQINQALHQLRAYQQHHGQPPQGYPPQGYQQQQGYPAQGQHQYPPQGQFQGQVPPQGHYQGQVPQGQYQGQIPPQGQYQGQVPQQAQYQGQVPQQAQYQGQVPQQAQYQGQVPQQAQYQGQVPQQAQFQNQVPPKTQYQGQVPSQDSQAQQNIPQTGQQGQVPQQQAQIPQQQGQVNQQQAQVPQQQGQVPQQAQVPHQGQLPQQGQQNVQGQQQLNQGQQQNAGQAQNQIPPAQKPVATNH